MVAVMLDFVADSKQILSYNCHSEEVRTWLGIT